MALDLERAKRAWNLIYCDMLTSDTEQGLVECYGQHATLYDQYVKDIGYTMPAETAKLLMKYGNLGAKSEILDVGAGTGILGKELQEIGFSGTIDGLDGSDGMLQVAKTRGLYRNLTQQFLTADCALDVGDAMYDAIASVGLFSAVHASASVTKCFFNHVNSGGLVIIALRVNESTVDDAKFNAELREILKSICDSGAATMLAEHPTNCFGVNFFSDDPSKPCPGMCFCLRKT